MTLPAMSAAIAKVLAEEDEIARLKAENKRLREALSDMYSGWRYIRREYGDLYGVGWGRCEGAARAALESSHD